ncbi:hypothetical protein LXL04_019823 [Taraxacum kok-saghyz]
MQLAGDVSKERREGIGGLDSKFRGSRSTLSDFRSCSPACSKIVADFPFNCQIGLRLWWEYSVGYHKSAYVPIAPDASPEQSVNLQVTIFDRCADGRTVVKLWVSRIVDTREASSSTEFDRTFIEETVPMEKHIQTFLNKISYLAITIATFTLLLIFLFQTPPETCINPAHNPNHIPHPKSSCEAAHRPTTTISKKNRRLWSTHTWRKSVDSYSTIFHDLGTLNHISNNTHALIVSAGGGQAVMSLKEMGLHDITGVELVDSPPLVSRADPHNLPFFDAVFNLGFSAHLDLALFPSRYVMELERTVMVGGVIVVCVEECGNGEMNEALKLFRKSEFSRAKNVTLMGSKMTMIIMRRVKART